MERKEHQLDGVLAQSLDELVIEIHRHHVVSTVTQRLGDTLAGSKADLALEAGSTRQHRDGHDRVAPGVRCP
jgi:hypothetical protein